jgi:hypothetical protein
MNKEIPTVITAKFTGDQRAVANEAQLKAPENPEEVIAANTKKTIIVEQEPCCGERGCKLRQ